MNEKFLIGDFAVTKDSKRLVEIKDMEFINGLNLYYTSDSTSHPETNLNGCDDSEYSKTVLLLSQIQVKNKRQERMQKTLTEWFKKSESERSYETLPALMQLITKLMFRKYGTKQFGHSNLLRYLLQV